MFREEDFVGFYAKRSGLLVCSFKSILDNFQSPTLSQNKLPYALKRRFFFVNFLKFFPCKNLLAIAPRSRRDRCQNRVAFLAGFRGAIAALFAALFANCNNCNNCNHNSISLPRNGLMRLYLSLINKWDPCLLQNIVTVFILAMTKLGRRRTVYTTTKQKS